MFSPGTHQKEKEGRKDRRKGWKKRREGGRKEPLTTGKT
jgi:hypothetical protein